jgi:hypothetical protein
MKVRNSEKNNVFCSQQKNVRCFIVNELKPWREILILFLIIFNANHIEYSTFLQNETQVKGPKFSKNNGFQFTKLIILSCYLVYDFRE